MPDYYQRQISLAENFIRLLQSLKTELSENETRYEAQLDSMADAGFMQNYVDPLTAQLSTFKVKNSDLQDSIEMNVDLLNRQIETIENLIEDAKARDI